MSNINVFPGFCDVHVHFREPGFSYKETIKSGSMAAARGGYTAVCTMPNLDPVPDSLRSIQKELDIINSDSVINIYPYGTITKGEKGEVLSDMEEIANLSVAFSDDGKGVQSEEMMLRAMLEAKKLKKIIAAHCEDDSLLNGGYIHDGSWALEHGHKGICSESEYRQIERDLELARQTGCAYHVCHISCAESVEAIRRAKRDGVDVTCETAPHYLVFDENDLIDDGRFKMNPPLRSRQDRLALIEGIKDGTIDMIATDHAPHSAEEKSRGLKGSSFGIVGLETAWAAIYTELVKKGIININKLVDLMAFNPRQRFNIPLGNDFTVWDLDAEYTVDPEKFLSMGKASPWQGRRLYGKCMMTVCGGRQVYKSEE